MSAGCYCPSAPDLSEATPVDLVAVLNAPLKCACCGGATFTPVGPRDVRCATCKATRSQP